MNKLDSFKAEVDYIHNPVIRNFAEQLILSMPDYFWEIPASSTGKYHPSYTLGAGGLYRHTRAAIRIAIELFRLDTWGFDSDTEDLIICALFGHDGWKSGIIKNEFSRADHPNVARAVIAANDTLSNILLPEQLDVVLGSIQSHMGQWNYDYRTKEVILPRPITREQRCVHLCDYLASRKCLIMDFDVLVVRE